MEKDFAHIRLRLPFELKEAIFIAAGKNKRSMNAEICARLEQSLKADAMVGDADLSDPLVLMQGIDQFLTRVKQQLEQAAQSNPQKGD